MIGTITFYRMRGSLSSGEYPLFSSGQDLSSYQVAQFPRVKYRGGMQATVELPYFQGLESANVAQIGGAFYWITEYRQRTAEGNQYTITLDYMGPTSLYRSGDSIKGSWHKLPTKVCPYLKNAVTNDIMRIVSSLEPTAIKCPTLEYSATSIISTYWVEVTGYDTNNAVKSFGCFIPYYVSRGGFYLDPGLPGVSWDGTDVYPNLGQILGNITGCCGLLAENIINISISKRCPYRFTAATGSTPSVKIDGYSPYKAGTLNVYMYELGGLIVYPTQTATVQISLSDFQRAVGQVCVRDWNGNSIMELSTMQGDTVTVTFQEISDVNGLYLKIVCLDQTLMLPEGHLPYQGSNWETYKAYQMDTDRMILENTLYNARQNRDTQMISGTINGIINGGQTGIMTGILGAKRAAAGVGITATAAGVGVSVWESQRAYELEQHNAEFQMDLSRRQAVNHPETSYNTGYGLVYGYQNENTPVRVCLMMPSTVDSDYYAAWVAEYGYPAEGVRTVTAVNGYYQGELLDTVGGMQQDRTNEAFMRGFRFVDPSGAGPTPPGPDPPTPSTYTLTVTFDTSGVTVPIQAKLFDANNTQIYAGTIGASGVWTVTGLSNGSYYIRSEDATLVFSPSAFAIQDDDAAYTCVISTVGPIVPTGTYTLSGYEAVYEMPDDTRMSVYRSVYYGDTRVLTPGAALALRFECSNGVTVDTDPSGWRYAIVPEGSGTFNAPIGLIYRVDFDTGYVIYNGKVYRTSDDYDLVYYADLVSIECSDANAEYFGQAQALNYEV